MVASPLHALAWLAATGWAFQSGVSTLGYGLGVPLILVAGLVSVTHFCIPSVIYDLLFPSRNAVSVQPCIRGVVPWNDSGEGLKKKRQ